MTDAGGWVKFHRAVLRKGWLSNHKLWAFWSYCLLKASHEEITVLVGNQKVHLAPGEFVFGRLKAAEDLGMSERQTRTCLDVLKTLENLTIKTTNKFSIISIVNWHTYQGAENINDQQNDQQHANKVPHTRSKEVKKKKYFSSDSAEYRLAALLFNCIVKRDHDFKTNLHSWAAHIDKLLHNDKRQPVDVVNTILWCQKDAWWQNNVLSAAKLREKFPQLFLKMGAGTNGHGAQKRGLVL